MDGHKFHELIREILAHRVFAVVGASRDPEKWGNRVYHSLKRHGYTVYAVNPNAESIDGEPVYPLLDNVPGQVDCAVTVVQPEVTFEIVRTAARLEIPYVWMQPGSESEPAINESQAVGIQAVYGGPCIMVESDRRAAQA